MGAGVAGLQAIATARRLGAVVTATDVRPAAKEQVESLGAKFIAVEDEEFKAAETAAGYAKEMSAGVPGQAGRARLRAHQEAGHRHHHRAHPRPPGAAAGVRGKVASMRPGSVIVDLAVEHGGNVEGVAADASHTWAASRSSASATYRAGSPPTPRASTPGTSRVPGILIDKKTKALAANLDDEILKATALTRDGAIVHPNFKPKSAA